MKRHRLSFGDWFFNLLEDHPTIANVWIPILVATATSLVCLWLSKQ